MDSLGGLDEDFYKLTAESSAFESGLVVSELLLSTASFDHTSMDDFYGNSVQGIGPSIGAHARPACAMEILMVMATWQWPIYSSLFPILVGTEHPWEAIRKCRLESVFLGIDMLIIKIKVMTPWFG